MGGSGGWVAVLLLSLYLLQVDVSASGSSAVDVSNGAELLEALNDTVIESISLTRDVFLTEADAAPFPLPIPISSHRTVVISSAPGAGRRTLDWGGMLGLLDQKPQSHLVFEDLVLQGAAPPSAAPILNLDTEMPGSILWPTVLGDVGHETSFSNVRAERIRSGCTRQFGESMANAFADELGHNSTIVLNETGLYVDDSMDIDSPITERLGHAQVGLAVLHIANVSFWCTEDPVGLAAAGGSPPPEEQGNEDKESGGSEAGSSGGGGTSGWLWAIIGTVVGVAVSAAVWVGFVVWRKKREQRLRVRRVEDLEGSKEPSSQSTSPPPEDQHPPTEVLVVRGEAACGSPPPERQPSNRSDDLNTMGAAMWNSRVGAIEGLELGEMLGRGSYGTAYRGRWKGAVVAVKVIEHCIQAGKSYNLAREPLVSMSASHPNVVTAYKLSLVCVKPMPAESAPKTVDEEGSECGSILASEEWALSDAPQSSSPQQPDKSSSLAAGGGSSSRPPGKAGSGSVGSGMGRPPALGHAAAAPAAAGGGGGRQTPVRSTSTELASEGVVLEVVSPNDSLPPGLYNTYIIMEYCDKGNLGDTITGGKFFSPHGSQQLDLVPVLLSLLDVALGLEYLHSINIVHGDLKARNCLLKTARNDRRGFQVKLADFGLSRMLNQGETHVHTQSYGTPTNAAPELLMHGKLTRSADVYSYGIIMWEIVAGEEAYSGMSTFQIIAQVAQAHHRPTIPDSCPPRLAKLMQQCWDGDPAQRPVFSEVVEELREMLRDVRKSADAARTASGALSRAASASES